MEYDESRRYLPGDDIRNIDWRVTARTGCTHTKIFCEERERPVHLWIDLSQPMFFATRGKYKAVIAAEMASLLAWAAHHQGDRIGGIVASQRHHYELKPQRGQAAVLRLINAMVTHPAWQQPTHPPAHPPHNADSKVDSKTDSKADSKAGMLKACVHLRRLARPGSLLVLLSDWAGFDDEINAHILHLRRHSELVIAHIYDGLEANLPPAGRYRITDGAQQLQFDSGNKQQINDYQNRFLLHQQSLQKLAHGARGRGRYLSCLTTDDPENRVRQGLGLG